MLHTLSVNSRSIRSRIASWFGQASNLGVWKALISSALIVRTYWNVIQRCWSQVYLSWTDRLYSCLLLGGGAPEPLNPPLWQTVSRRKGLSMYFVDCAWPSLIWEQPRCNYQPPLLLYYQWQELLVLSVSTTQNSLLIFKIHFISERTAAVQKVSPNNLWVLRRGLMSPFLQPSVTLEVRPQLEGGDVGSRLPGPGQSPPGGCSVQSLFTPAGPPVILLVSFTLAPAGSQTPDGRGDPRLTTRPALMHHFDEKATISINIRCASYLQFFSVTFFALSLICYVWRFWLTWFVINSML